MAIAMDSATTLDLLGGVSSSCTSSSELDIDSTSDLKLDFEMSAPRGWEKRLDLKAGRFYYVNLSTGRRSYNHPHNLLNWNSQLAIDSSELDLKLNLGGLSSRAPARVRAGNVVSTIEAVEEALKRSSSSSCSSRKRKTLDSTSTTSSTSSSSGSKLSSESPIVAESTGGVFSKVVLSGCKRCLMYVMLNRSDPRCPKCGTAVVIDIPLEQYPKKPRLELSLL